MRFTLFAQAEGVRSTSTDPFWATESASGMVTDASLSARTRGVSRGMPMRTAKALVPELKVEEETEGFTTSFDAVLKIVFEFTPWIEVASKDAFFFQLPGDRPPLKEIRRILHLIDKQLTEQQRIQIGLAETPSLARAVVEWDKVEQVNGALYWRVGRQLWLVAPSLAQVVSGRMSASATAGHEPAGGPPRNKSVNTSAGGPRHELANTSAGKQYSRSIASAANDWIANMPIPAFWHIPANARVRLMSLGVVRVGELVKVPVSYLKRHFGEESLMWTKISQFTGNRLCVNYPLQKFIKEWFPVLGEEVPSNLISAIVLDLAHQLAEELRRSELGALKIQMVCKTDTVASDKSSDVYSYERTIKQPIYQTEQFLAAVAPAFEECHLESISLVQLSVEEIQPLTSVQLALSEQRPEERRGTVDIWRIIRHVNHKFPDSIRVGIRPSFRELRLQAALEGAGGGWTSTNRQP